MERLFLTLVNMSLSAGWIVLAVVLTRLFLKHIPKWIPCLLWAVGVAAMLLYSLISWICVKLRVRAIPATLLTG